VDEVAEYFSISVRTVYRLIDEGGVKTREDTGLFEGAGMGNREIREGTGKTDRGGTPIDPTIQ